MHFKYPTKKMPLKKKIDLPGVNSGGGFYVGGGF